ncbi:MAG: hypothetical protein KAS32_12415 [Candidatus Peribacteraceae bacterium]|nr:hypothetical protein [Candidatus Peribacteraceae bacterium]
MEITQEKIIKALKRITATTSVRPQLELIHREKGVYTATDSYIAVQVLTKNKQSSIMIDPTTNKKHSTIKADEYPEVDYIINDRPDEKRELKININLHHLKRVLSTIEQLSMKSATLTLTLDKENPLNPFHIDAEDKDGDQIKTALMPMRQ